MESTNPGVRAMNPYRISQACTCRCDMDEHGGPGVWMLVYRSIACAAHPGPLRSRRYCAHDCRGCVPFDHMEAFG